MDSGRRAAGMLDEGTRDMRDREVRHVSEVSISKLDTLASESTQAGNSGLAGTCHACRRYIRGMCRAITGSEPAIYDGGSKRAMIVYEKFLRNNPPEGIMLSSVLMSVTASTWDGGSRSHAHMLHGASAFLASIGVQQGFNEDWNLLRDVDYEMSRIIMRGSHEIDRIIGEGWRT